MAEWTTFAFGTVGPAAARGADPIFGRPIGFYLFTLPAWQLVVGWLTTIGMSSAASADLLRGRARRHAAADAHAARQLDTAARLSMAFAGVLLAIALRSTSADSNGILTDHTRFSPASPTPMRTWKFRHAPGVRRAGPRRGAGARQCRRSAEAGLDHRVGGSGDRRLYRRVGVVGWYVNGFVVKPNELVREGAFIAHNIEMTRQAFALDRIEQIAVSRRHRHRSRRRREQPGDAAEHPAVGLAGAAGHAAADSGNPHLLRFPDIDIDRYEVDGIVRQMMLAVRELNIERLPESSRNWINEKLIYTHGYGVTMNPVNGFTPEGLPTLILGNMPVQSTVPGLTVTRPEVYFGELTNTDVYVKTRQKEFNYPQGETNNQTSYEGTGGITLGGFLRRLLIALDRGDITKLPFSDDITADSRLLMRRNITERVEALAPFLTFDPDPYIVVTDDGRLFWMMDGFTTSDTYPYARHYRLGNQRDQLPAQQRESGDRRLRRHGHLLRVRRRRSDHRRLSRDVPDAFRDASAMPPDLRKHVRYPELLLELQAAVYGLYHMTAPDVFYNREDLWTVATEVGLSERRDQATQTMEPNFVLMKLPGEARAGVHRDPAVHAREPEQPDWLDCRTQRRPNYGTAIVYNFPENAAGRRTAADRGAHRSERAAVRTAVAVESAGIARPPRQPDRHSDRPGSAVCRADLSPGRAQPDAGAADRRARAAGPARLRTEFRDAPWPACSATAAVDARGRRSHRWPRRRARSDAGSAPPAAGTPPTRTPSSPAPRRTSRTTSA